MSLFTFIHDLGTRFYHDFWYEVLRFDHAVMRFSLFFSFHLIPHRLLKADLSVLPSFFVLCVWIVPCSESPPFIWFCVVHSVVSSCTPLVSILDSTQLYQVTVGQMVRIA